MYVCIRYKSAIGHVCIFQIQVSDRSYMYVLDTRVIGQECAQSCMYVLDTMREIGHVCMC